MSRRAYLHIAMIVFTLASSLGESLHALPGLAHDDASAACQVRTDHMEAPAEEPHDDCPICQAATPFQAIAPEPGEPVSIEVTTGWIFSDCDIFVFDRFESVSARGPPSV